MHDVATDGTNLSLPGPHPPGKDPWAICAQQAAVGPGRRMAGSKGRMWVAVDGRIRVIDSISNRTHLQAELDRIGCFVEHDRVRVTLLFQGVSEVRVLRLLQQIVVRDEGRHHKLWRSLHQI